MRPSRRAIYWTMKRMDRGLWKTSGVVWIVIGTATGLDPVVASCAARLGNPGLDLLALRSKHLEQWRKVLAMADEDERLSVLEQRIEADLLEAIGDALPRGAREGLERIAGSAEATVAGLLLLRRARKAGAVSLEEIIAYVKEHSEELGDETRVSIAPEADAEPH